MCHWDRAAQVYRTVQDKLQKPTRMQFKKLDALVQQIVTVKSMGVGACHVDPRQTEFGSTGPLSASLSTHVSWPLQISTRESNCSLVCMLMTRRRALAPGAYFSLAVPYTQNAHVASRIARLQWAPERAAGQPQ